MSKNGVDERVCELWQDKDQSPFGLKSLSAHRFLESTALRRGLFHGVVCYMFQRHSVDSCLLYTSPSPRDRQKSRMPSSA